MNSKKVKINSVEIIDNVSDFLQPFLFRVTFECIESIEEQVFEWKVVYVGSAETQDLDQILLHEHYGPFTVGQHTIDLRSNPPDPTKIPQEELEGTTVLFLIGRLNQNDYFQVGYIVSNEYLEEKDPQFPPVYQKLKRTVLKDFPRVFDS